MRAMNPPLWTPSAGLKDNANISRFIGHVYILFVKLNQDYELTETLMDKIKKTLRRNASPRHVPAVIIQSHDIA